ncbi:glycine cleavage T C-terminal barrel domain-containing protein [soil metagenome]
MSSGVQRAAPAVWPNTRIRPTPFTPRVEAAGVVAYTVYNHTLLPVMFRSLDEDYWHLKEHVQLWDVSCQRQIEVRGPDAARMVQLLTPRDLSAAGPGRCLYAPLVDSRGGVVNDPVISVLADDRYWLSIADADVGLWVSGLAHGLGAEVEVTEPAVSPLAVQGPKAEELMARVFGEQVRDIRFFRFAWLEFAGHPLMVARTGWSRQGGFEIYLDRPELGLPLWDTLWEAGEGLGVEAGCPNLIERIEGGLLSYGGDFTRDNNPFECRFDRFCHLDRPFEFIGRPALEQIAAQGPQRRVMGLQIDATRLSPCVEPWPVMVDARRVGQVTSAVVSPARRCGVAIAMLDRDHAEPGRVVVVSGPDGDLAATVSDLPFPVSEDADRQPA